MPESSAQRRPPVADHEIADATTPSLEERLEERVAELSILHQVGEALQSAMELPRILHAILVGATSHHGLSLNRAFLLLVDDDDGRLRGRAAIGPADAEEAARIWNDISLANSSLKELLRDLGPVLLREDHRVNEIVRTLDVPVDGDDFLARACRSRDTVLVIDGHDTKTDDAVDRELLDVLGTMTLVAVPLVAEDRHVGLLLADNAITGRPIDPADIQLLEMLGVQAALAIQRAKLTAELESYAAALEAAGREIQENQARLLDAERMSALGQMAASVAHEIRNPLVVIGGFARRLLESLEHDESAASKLAVIIEEVERLERIVAPVLDSAKDRPPVMAPIDLTKIASDAFALLQYEMDQCDVLGHFEADTDVGLAVGDRDQILQALINVMQNAVHAMPAGGNLWVYLRRDGDRVELVVEDDGIGIPEDVREQVHQPFFTTKAAGTGLGLPIVAQIMRNHQGELDIDTEVGRGTTVFLRLRAADRE